MTRAEAIKCIEEDGIRLGAGDFVDVEALKVAVACMQEQERNKWISVKDRLPRYGERVLITEGHGVFEAALSVSHKWVRCGVGWTESVTHWMPLPEPPKEDAE